MSTGADDIRLTQTSYVVLGMLRWLGPSSPYRLKRALERTIADFHPVPHTSFYVEPARLARAGYLSESQEEGGRRRKSYALTENGDAALDDWLADPEAEHTQIRSPAMLKVFFGAPPGDLARAEIAHHEHLLAGFERMRDRNRGSETTGSLASLDTGIAFHRFWIAEWKRLLRELG